MEKDEPATCRNHGCGRTATHTVIVNAPGRGYAEDKVCGEHAEKARGKRYVRNVVAKVGGQV